jgi:hypothetical protein
VRAVLGERRAVGEAEGDREYLRTHPEHLQRHHDPLVELRATDSPGSENDATRPDRLLTASRWCTKSKSRHNTTSVPMGRVMIPRPVRWNGTCHQWLHGGA